MSFLSVLSRVLLTALASGLLLTAPGLAADSLLIDDFEKDFSGWEEEIFKGRNSYLLIDDLTGNKALQVSSSNSASALIRKIEIDPAEFPVLRWRWKISGTLASGNARVKAKDDYPARIYVIFPHWLKPLTRTINYIWANRLEIGEVVPSPYFSRSVMVAVESGDQLAGQWITEKRNFLEDYRRVFGEEPAHVGAIALMTDSDNTGESVQAWYDDIQLLKSD